MKIYLAGSVPKGDAEAAKFDNWRERYQQVLGKVFDASFIDPYDRKLDESDFLQVFGVDCKHIKDSDLIVVYAENRLGVGTSQEMVVAKYFSKPVLTVLPKDTYHRRQNVVFNGSTVKDWIHPFIHSFSDAIIEDIKDVETVKDNLLKGRIKTISIIDEALDYLETL